MVDVTINISMDAKCAECRRAGATPSGLCLGCVTKAMDQKRTMKSPHGRAMQEKLKRHFAASRPSPEDK